MSDRDKKAGGAEDSPVARPAPAASPEPRERTQFSATDPPVSGERGDSFESGEESGTAALPQTSDPVLAHDLADQIGRKEARRLRAKSQQHRRVWFGFGMFGLVGWSVAIPTLLGAAAGMWIDARWKGQQSWTLMLLIGGLLLGCLNAWRWVRDESEVR